MALANLIPEPIELASPASSESIQALAAKLALALPLQYQQLLLEADGIHANNVQIYSCGTAPERNETYEVARYAPGYVLVGSVCGAPILLGAGDQSPVYQGDWGSMDPGYFTLLGPSLEEWIVSGCPDREALSE